MTRQAKNPGSRNVPQDATLSKEFKRQNYIETIARMYDSGLIPLGTARTMLDRVEKLVEEE